jgi:hypothetical protein
VQFVPLKVETNGDQWAQWRSKYQAEGNGIPIVYVIRADGQQMYGRSGNPGDALPVLMAEQLAQAGRVLSDQESTLLRDALQAAKAALGKDDPHAAVKALSRVKKLGTPGSLGSFARAALELDQLVEQLTQQGKTQLDQAQQTLSGGDHGYPDAAFEALLSLVAAKRIYGTLPALSKDLTAAVRQINRDSSLRDYLKQAEALDRARACIALPAGKRRAAAALRRIVETYPGTPAEKLARNELEKLTAATDSPAAAADKPAQTGPGDKPPPTDPKTALKKAAAWLNMAKTFAAKSPEKARKYAQMVIDLVPGTDQAQEAQELLDRLK